MAPGDTTFIRPIFFLFLTCLFFLCRSANQWFFHKKRFKLTLLNSCNISLVCRGLPDTYIQRKSSFLSSSSAVSLAYGRASNKEKNASSSITVINGEGESNIQRFSTLPYFVAAIHASRYMYIALCPTFHSSDSKCLYIISLHYMRDEANEQNEAYEEKKTTKKLEKYCHCSLTLSQAR